MRFGEIATLLWQHINTRNREILVIDPNNGDTRSIPMTDRILDMFEQMGKSKQDELVFPSEYGKERTRVSKVFAAAVNALGL